MPPQANKIVDALVKIAIGVLVAGTVALFSKIQSMEVSVATAQVRSQNMTTQLAKMELKVDELVRRQQEILLALAKLTKEEGK